MTQGACPLCDIQLSAISSHSRGGGFHARMSLTCPHHRELTLRPQRAVKEAHNSLGSVPRKIADCDWAAVNTLSQKYIDLLRQYYYVGGMPEACCRLHRREGAGGPSYEPVNHFAA